MPKGRKCRRVDGLCGLTAEQKAERDARMYYWMNQRKIERVAEGALRARLRQMSKEDFELLELAEKAGL